MRVADPLAGALMLASGFAGLGYQIVWTQQASLWLGHEAAAVLAVVTAFFGGLALGAGVLGSRIERSRHALRWYAGCELLIALWSVVLAFALGPVSDWVLNLTGPQATPLWQWSVALVATWVLLLPATAAMGATLPALQAASAGPRVAALYACNTAGGVLGVLAAAFWLVPQLGLLGTAAVCASCNVLCAAAAWRMQRAAPPAHAVPERRSSRAPLALLFGTGLLGIGYEVVVVRVLSQVTEATVYTFALLLAVYLVGTALGAAAWQGWLTRRAPQADALARARDRLLVALAAACLIGGLSLWPAEALRDAVQGALGTGMASALMAETALAIAAFGGPALLMGALFAALAGQAQPAGLGRALAVNTLGASAAPLCVGVLLVPAVGPKFALLALASAYLLLAAPRALRMPAAWATAAAAAVVALMAAPLAHVDLPEGARLISYHEGAMAAVSVVEDADGVARLRINNRQQEGSSATLLADARQAWLPVLLHPAPRRVLFMGLGTGMTATSAAEDATLQVDAVELLPEVIAASAHFTAAFKASGADARLHTIAADARRTVRGPGAGYDVIVADNFHPARSGSGSLYTVEHFRAVRHRLQPGGLFCQWLPLHQLDLDTVRSIVRSFIAADPQAHALLATHSLDTPVLGLVMRRDAQPWDLPALQRRLAAHALPQRLDDYALHDAYALLGSFIAGPQALARWADGAELNTDDRPIVSYRAPRITYAADSTPRVRLTGLLDALQIAPHELLLPGTGDEAARLAAYWSARREFIAAGQRVRPVPDLEQMLAQVRGPLLAVLRTSPDFRPAYDPLLRMALALGRSDAPRAMALLQELQHTQPARPEARLALARLRGDTP